MHGDHPDNPCPRPPEALLNYTSATVVEVAASATESL